MTVATLVADKARSFHDHRGTLCRLISTHVQTSGGSASDEVAILCWAWVIYIDEELRETSKWLLGGELEEAEWASKAALMAIGVWEYTGVSVPYTPAVDSVVRDTGKWGRLYSDGAFCAPAEWVIGGTILPEHLLVVAAISQSKLPLEVASLILECEESLILERKIALGQFFDALV